MDFCSNFSFSSVGCSVPSLDGYPIENLIGASESRCKGFLSTQYVRPPIDINITFKFPSTIREVLINTRIASRQITGFALFLSASKNDENSDSNSLVDYMPVGKYFTEKETIVRIKNTQYRNHPDFPLIPPPSSINEKTVLTQYMRKDSVVHPVQRVKLRIFRAAEFGPGCIAVGGIQIIGHPMKQYCSESQWQDVLKMYQNFRKKTDHSIFPWEKKPVLCFSDSLQPQKADDKRENTEISEPSINDPPEEFLDKLTFHLMKTPMLLPSGVSIDATTLDRYIAEESSWNRPPSDPFTGVPFTDLLKPIYNASLRRRIDRFIILKKVDTSPPVAAPTPEIKRSAVPQSSNTSTAEEGSTPAKRQKLNDTSDFMSRYQPVNQPSLPSTSESVTIAPVFSSHLMVQSTYLSTVSRVTKKNPTSSNLSRNLLDKKPTHLNHGDGLHLQYNKYKSSNLLPKTKCNGCDILLNLYKLDCCTHILCRKCLTKAQCDASSPVKVQYKCPACDSTFSSDNISKFHV